MHIIPLEKSAYYDFPLHYAYKTDAHYVPRVVDTHEEMSYTLKRERYPDGIHEEENTDTLYQDYWNAPEAFAATDDENQILGYAEIDFEEWNNRLRVTQLLVKPEARYTGVGTFLMNYIKRVAKARDYRVIVLETQNYNTPAIDFYRANGFRFCGGNTCFYSNTDVEDDEVMLEMAYYAE